MSMISSSSKSSSRVDDLDDGIDVRLLLLLDDFDDNSRLRNGISSSI